MEDIRRCKKRGRRALSWAWARRWGGGPMRQTAPLGIGAIRAGSFLPVEAAGGYKPWQARTFAAGELARSMTLKSYWVQKP